MVLERGDVLDTTQVQDGWRRHQPADVMHFVGETRQQPLLSAVQPCKI